LLSAIQTEAQEPCVSAHLRGCATLAELCPSLGLGFRTCRSEVAQAGSGGGAGPVDRLQEAAGKGLVDGTAAAALQPQAAHTWTASCASPSSSRHCSAETPHSGSGRELSAVPGDQAAAQNKPSLPSCRTQHGGHESFTTGTFPGTRQCPWSLPTECQSQTTQCSFRNSAQTFRRLTGTRDVVMTRRDSVPAHPALQPLDCICHLLQTSQGHLSPEEQPPCCIASTHLFFSVLEFELRVYTLSHFTGPFCVCVCEGFFRQGLLNYLPSWPQTPILLISAS
jgi:hypothetical protein